MRRFVMMVLCIVLAVVVGMGCGDDGDDTGGGSTSTSSTSSGGGGFFTGGTSSGGGDTTSGSSTTEAGIPVEGATPRDGWCDAMPACVNPRDWEDWETLWASDAGEVGREDFCGCSLTLYACEGAPFEFEDINDPLYDACAVHTNKYPFPRN